MFSDLTIYLQLSRQLYIISRQQIQEKMQNDKNYYKKTILANNQYFVCRPFLFKTSLILQGMLRIKLGMAEATFCEAQAARMASSSANIIQK